MTFRVVQWATGNQGVEAIRACAASPEFEIVGGWVSSDAKEGLDLGTIANIEPIGVTATQDVDALLALGADCVIYTPRIGSIDEVCRILASGANVVTTAFLFHPQSLPAPDLARIETACRAGNATLHGTGLNPGVLSGVLPLALSSMSRTVDKVTLQERADWSFYESTHITFDNMRFGRPAAEVNEDASEFLRFNSGLFKEMVALIASSLGAQLDAITTDVELVDATADHDILGVTLAAGTVAGQRWCWRGVRGDDVLVEIETLWTVGGEYPKHWPRPLDGWTLTIEGDPSFRTHTIALASFERPEPISEHVRAASIATVMAAVNAIPAVCAAPAGVATMADLPLIRASRGFAAPH